jgi:hypothetical protein
MKKYINRVLLTAMAMLFLLYGVACASNTYRADVTSTVITDSAKTAVGNAADYFDASAETYDIYFGTEDAFAAVEDCNIVYHETETNVDQFGVFRVKPDGDVAAVEAMVRSYVDGQVAYLNSFAAAYNRDELVKIENAKVSTLGSYVYFTILSEDGADAFVNAVRAAIEK